MAQLADVVGGRQAPLDATQQKEADKKVPLEVTSEVKHDKRGILSMARYGTKERSFVLLVI